MARQRKPVVRFYRRPRPRHRQANSSIPIGVLAFLTALSSHLHVLTFLLAAGGLGLSVWAVALLRDRQSIAPKRTYAGLVINAWAMILLFAWGGY